jgi:hypothetical protein
MLLPLLQVGVVNNFSLIRECHGDLNQYTSLQGKNLTNKTYAHPWTGHVS